MKLKQRLFGATHPPRTGTPTESPSGDAGLMRELKMRAAQLPDEGRFPSLDGATGWLNSEPLTPEGLRGKVVLVDFWTFTCVNWLRTLPYVRAWAQKYRDKGLVVIGAHTPEFPFEGNIDNVRRAAQEMRVDYPIAVDTNYGVWRAFDNNYWPALYFIDAMGKIRHHHYGEGAYEMSEMVIQQLLADSGASGITEELVSVEPEGTEVAADWETLESGETYVGYAQDGALASPGGAVEDETHTYTVPTRLSANHWALSGVWTITEKAAVLNEAHGRVVFRFHARDVNLVMGPPKAKSPIRFRVLLDGKSPSPAHGTDVDSRGEGRAVDQRLYQLIRQPGQVKDATFEIEFLDPGVEAYCFTFG